MEKYKEIERSIIKTYRKDIWSRFIKAVIEYRLINEGDNIMVCISGGKDSFLLAKCIQELQRHGKYKFNAHYVVMDPGYSDFNRSFIEDNAKILNVPIEIFKSDIFDVVEKIGGKSACYMCARMRRGALYKKAQALGCNKIALGHHFDDVIETTLMSMFYASEIKTMMPKLHSENYKGIECSLINDGTSKRKEVKDLIKKLRKKSPNIDEHIFKALDNVSSECILGWRIGKNHYSFLDNYDNQKRS